MGGVKILLVEDESIGAMDIKRTLESFGYEVPHVASSGNEAIEKAFQLMPDIVLMDIVLKGKINGISAASKIRDLDIPVIYLTAHSEESTVQEAKLTEPYGYLIKPYDPVSLKNAIELALYRHEMEIKLRKSEERYRSILENIQDAYFRADREGCIIMASPSAASMHHFSNTNELIGIPTIALYKNPEDRDSLMEELNKNGKIEDYECEGLRKDGTSFWVSMNVQFHYDEQGKIQGTEGFMRDITQRKNAENQIKKSENYYRTIFEHTGTATIIIDQDMTISLANSEFERLSGFMKDEIEGEKKWTEFVVTDNLTRMKKYHDLRRIKADKAPETYEFKFITRNGGIKDILLNVASITGTKKSVASLLDITQRKKAENAFHDSEERFRTLFEGNTAVMVLLDPETGNIIDANPSAAEFYGYSLETLRSMNIVQINQLSVEEMNRAMERAKNGGYNFIFPHKLASGEIRTVEVLTSPIHSKDKVLLFSIINDITERRKAEISLKESEAKFRFLTDKINDIVWTQNLDLQTTYVSPSIEKVLGFSQEEWMKQKIQEQLTPPSLAIVTSVLEEQLLLEEQDPEDKDRTLTLELEYYHKDGSTLWLENSVSCVHDDQGNLIGIHGVSRDITQRRKDEAALKKSEETFKSLIYNSTDLIRILDENGLIVFDSPSSTRILGYPEGSLLGRSPLEFIHPDDLERVSHDLGEVYKKCNPGTPTEFRIRKANGEYLPVESVSLNMMDVPGIEGIVVTTHPIKERKEMEDALRESEEKYRTLFEEDPDYTLLLGKDGMILEVNDSIIKITGLSQEELVGRHFTELDMVFPDDMQKHLKKLPQVLNGEPIKPFESRIFDNKGNVHWIQTRATTIQKGEDIKYFLVISTNITEQKMAQKELEESLQEKDVLLREIHHRVKNNMQIISSLLNLQIQHVDGEESVNVLKESQGRVKSMAMIHEKLYQSPSFTNIQFKNYVEKLVSDIFYSYGIKDGNIKPILEIQDLNIGIDTAIPLGLIINELVTNSVKYAFPEGEGAINIELKSKSGELELIVSDNGIGLPISLDIENTKTLGLQLVNSLTHQIDGKIVIQRTQGTEFRIKFNELVYRDRI